MKKEIYPQKLIDDYDLILSAYPDLFKLRELVAQTIGRYFKDNQEVTLLEIGAGRGETTQYILKQTANLKIIAIDEDPNMAKSLIHNLKQYITNDRITVIEQDIFNYIKDIEDRSLDCVASSWTIHNFKKEKRQELFGEIYRVLKPQGLFVNMDKFVADNPIKEQKSFDEVANRLNKISDHDIAKAAIRHEDEDRHPDYIMKTKESIRIMKEIGFKKVKILKRINREAVLSCIK